MMAQPGEDLAPQPGGPEFIPVASPRLNEHYRGSLTAPCLSPAQPALFSRSPPAPLSRLLLSRRSSQAPHSSVQSPTAPSARGGAAGSSLLSPDRGGALRLAGDRALRFRRGGAG